MRLIGLATIRLTILLLGMVTPVRKLMDSRPDQTDFILIHASYLIEKYGWTQGELGSTLDGFCALGAIGKSLDDRGMEGRGYLLNRSSAAIRLANSLGLNGPWDIPDWNDTPGRTKEEVVTAMRNATGRD